MKIKKTLGDKIFDLCNVLFFIAFAAVTFYPFLHQLSISLSEKSRAMSGGFFFYPRGFTIAAYRFVLQSNYIFLAFKNSIIITVGGVLLCLVVCSSYAYIMSKRDLPGYKFWNFIVIFSILFSGGLIPEYLVVRSLGLTDNLLALILLGAITPFNIVIIKNFFQNLPKSLEESAIIDGARPLKIFTNIVLPLSKPVLATISIWVAVSQWNNFMRGLMYLPSRHNYILPVLIRDIVIGQSDLAVMEVQSETTGETVTAATIIVALVPILMVYPFLQKHFTKGIMLGAVKG